MAGMTFRSRIGTVILTDNDMPERISDGSAVTGGEQLLSDGSRILAVTGLEPSDTVLTGTIREVDNGLSPEGKIKKLEAMVAAGNVIVSPFAGGAKVRSVLYDFIEDGKIQYTITLFRETAGSLSGSDLSSQQFAGPAQVSAQSGALANSSPGLSAKSQAALGQYLLTVPTIAPPNN